MELPHIGQACVVCNRNDYLPFKCSKCDKIICIDHRTDHGSDCPLNKSEFVYDNSKPVESLKQTCDFCHKITLKLELTKCSQCLAHHCLYHRHQMQHNCIKLDEDKKTRELEDAARVARQQEALDTLKQVQRVTCTSSKATVITTTRQALQDPKKQALARRVRIMKIRQLARGPPNILDKDKIYFEVKFVHEPKSSLSLEGRNGKSVNIFATAKHSVGRLIDWAADELDVTNKNHTLDCDQLIFRVQPTGTEELPFINLDNGSIFQRYLDSGEVSSGDELQITYALNPT